MNRTLIKITLLAVFDPEDLAKVDAASLGDASAELLRDHGALTVASEYDEVHVDVANEDDDIDELVSVLTFVWPGATKFPPTKDDRVIGWTVGDGSGHEGYTVSDYFGPRGNYLGPDKHGIEPIFETKEGA